MPPAPPADRISSLDQFRGFTVLAMFVVNFAAGQANVPTTLKHHHTYCSFADTVMPAFLFAVGFGYRLSFLRRREKDGARAAVRHAVGRNLGLILVGVILYHLTGGYTSWDDLTAAVGEPDFLLKRIKRGPFETLTHIGVTSLWVLPVIGAAGWVRGLWAAASAGLHVGVSYAGYYEWNLSPPAGIDGGPLGFLTWTVPLVAGSLTYDWTVAGPPRPGRLVLLAVGLMAAGVGLSGLSPAGGLPFVHPAEAPSGPAPRSYWTMSQRAGSVTYLLFGAGFAAAVFGGFRLACDRWGWRSGFADLFGRHALTGYILHGLVAGAVKPFVPRDAPGWYVLAAGLVYLAVITVVLRHLDRHRLVLKL